jgi:hypothetical protein
MRSLFERLCGGAVLLNEGYHRLDDEIMDVHSRVYPWREKHGDIASYA